MVPHHLTPQTMTLLLQLIIHPMLHQQHMAPRLKHLLHQLLLLPMLHQLHHTQPWLTPILDNLSPYVDPMEAPPDANIHHMLWRYVYKMCGTPKARMVCNGSSRQGTTTLGHTFANCLYSISERLFWSAVACNSLVAYGAGVSNAFAEAPPLAHPLYMRIDDTSQIPLAVGETHQWNIMANWLHANHS